MEGEANARREEDARATALNRVDERLERLAAQRKALRRAMESFGDGFDASAWAKAYESPDPDDINSVFAVTGGYLALVNNTAEALRAGAKLVTL